jgi:thiamine biosynthesis lipoprotein
MLLHVATPTVDRTFAALGTEVRLVVTAPRAAALARRAEDEVRRCEEALSRFRPGSELCALNADPRPVVPASPLLREAVAAALWAAHTTGGLVDPTLLDRLEAAGYTRSLAGRRREGAARADRPPATPARPHPAARWRSIAVLPDAVARPPGLRLDLGGSGKGHIADRVAAILARADRWCVDCGGDLRVGGDQEVLVAHPVTGAVAARARLSSGAVATSSVLARAWTNGDGRRAHHLIDPATGEPAHTGLVAATVFAPTTLEAETFAKAALLSGPRAARAALRDRRALLWHDDGTQEEIGG